MTYEFNSYVTKNYEDDILKFVKDDVRFTVEENVTSIAEVPLCGDLWPPDWQPGNIEGKDKSLIVVLVKYTSFSTVLFVLWRRGSWSFGLYYRQGNTQRVYDTR